MPRSLIDPGHLAHAHRSLTAVLRIDVVGTLIGWAGRLAIAGVAKLDASGGGATAC